MYLEFECKDISELRVIAARIIETGTKKIIFFGGLGSGKTTFIKFLCRELGIEELVSSPTFTLMNHYSGNGLNVFHFDFYRLEKTEDLFELGYEEYFFSENYVFIEWPDKAKELIPEHFSKMRITSDELGIRTFIWED